MMGVGAVRQDIKAMILTGFAGLVAGACSMAIGEFVSVYSQYDRGERELAKPDAGCSCFGFGLLGGGNGAVVVSFFYKAIQGEAWSDNRSSELGFDCVWLDRRCLGEGSCC
ncbi:Vacuolar iron transporter homolog 1 [Linum perenne]